MTKIIMGFGLQPRRVSGVEALVGSLGDEVPLKPEIKRSLNLSQAFNQF